MAFVTGTAELKVTGTFISLIGSDSAENLYLIIGPRNIIMTQFGYDTSGKGLERGSEKSPGQKTGQPRFF